MNSKTKAEVADDRRGEDTNPDPITGAPGSHPVGTAIGSASGAATGAAIGAFGGPVGMAVGGVIGAIVGGAAGHGVAEEIDPTAEDAHWQENYDKRPHYKPDFTFPDYQPAFRMGYMGARTKPGTSFADQEAEMKGSWDKNRGESRLEWEDAKQAAEDAWDRVDRKRTRNSNDDGMTAHL